MQIRWFSFLILKWKIHEFQLYENIYQSFIQYFKLSYYDKAIQSTFVYRQGLLLLPVIRSQSTGSEREKNTSDDSKGLSQGQTRTPINRHAGNKVGDSLENLQWLDVDTHNSFSCTVESRNNGCEGTNNLYLLKADFRYRQYRE